MFISIKSNRCKRIKCVDSMSSSLFTSLERLTSVRLNVHNLRRLLYKANGVEWINSINAHRNNVNLENEQEILANLKNRVILVADLAEERKQ